MEIVRHFEGAEIKVKVTDDELLTLIANMGIDERVVFLRKLFQADMAKALPFPFSLLTNKL
tara:strand:- start:722 stop:904 length:183 start_codon:yes stop_codon:yes gene_type:complete